VLLFTALSSTNDLVSVLVTAQQTGAPGLHTQLQLHLPLCVAVHSAVI
jgi:hypothetical protein